MLISISRRCSKDSSDRAGGWLHAWASAGEKQPAEPRPRPRAPMARLADGRVNGIASWSERPRSPQGLAAGDVAFVGFEHVGEIGVQLGIIDAGQGFAQRAHHPALAAVEEVEALARVLDRQQLVVERTGGAARLAAEAGDVVAQHGAEAGFI